MKVYKLQYTHIIDSDINKVFDFFSNPENLALITPSKLDFKILTPVPIKMKEGQLIDYTIKLAGFNIRWRTMITEYLPMKSFVDQQLVGPYSMWHHTHEFEELDGCIKMIDTINYVMPFGLIGRIVNAFWVKRDLNKIFEYRKKIINEYFIKGDN